VSFTPILLTCIIHTVCIIVSDYQHYYQLSLVGELSTSLFWLSLKHLHDKRFSAGVYWSMTCWCCSIAYLHLGTSDAGRFNHCNHSCVKFHHFSVFLQHILTESTTANIHQTGVWIISKSVCHSNHYPRYHAANCCRCLTIRHPCRFASPEPPGYHSDNSSRTANIVCQPELVLAYCPQLILWDHWIFNSVYSCLLCALLVKHRCKAHRFHPFIIESASTSTLIVLPQN